MHKITNVYSILNYPVVLSPALSITILVRTKERHKIVLFFYKFVLVHMLVLTVGHHKYSTGRYHPVFKYGECFQRLKFILSPASNQKSIKIMIINYVNVQVGLKKAVTALTTVIK